MADWSELAKKFKKDANDARTTGERATQKHELLETKGPELWRKLGDLAKDAVAEINRETGDGSLSFKPSDTAQSFSVVYSVLGKQRMASATFSASSHKVTIGFGGNMPSPSPSVEYEVRVENDGSVLLHGAQGDKSAEEIVDLMLHRLPGGSA